MIEVETLVEQINPNLLAYLTRLKIARLLTLGLRTNENNRYIPKQQKSASIDILNGSSKPLITDDVRTYSSLKPIIPIFITPTYYPRRVSSNLGAEVPGLSYQR